MTERKAVRCDLSVKTKFITVKNYFKREMRYTIILLIFCMIKAEIKHNYNNEVSEVTLYTCSYQKDRPLSLKGPSILT